MLLCVLHGVPKPLSVTIEPPFLGSCEISHIGMIITGSKCHLSLEKAYCDNVIGAQRNKPGTQRKILIKFTKQHALIL